MEISPFHVDELAAQSLAHQSSPGAGIAWYNNTTLVVQGNTVTGGFRDAISLDDNVTSENVDVVGNTMEGYKDDGAESKGGASGRSIASPCSTSWL